MSRIKTVDFTPTVKICNHCLQLYNNPDFEPKTTNKSNGLCKPCNEVLSINLKKRNELIAKQLRFFLTYGHKRDSHKDSTALVAYSGGTDSTLALYLAKEELKLDVVAFKLNNSWERLEINKKSEEFCSKFSIPLVTANSDFQSLFLRRHPDIQDLEDEVLIEYPWCRLCAEDGGLVWAGVIKAARLLGIQRIITGNNFFIFGKVPIEENCIRPQVRLFMRRYSQWLSPVSAVWIIPQADCIMINLPIALGYTKQKKIEKLSDIGYSLPQSYFRAPESDCNLGVLIPCAGRILKQLPQEPKASAYMEFLSGYITREEWLESLLRANSFSKTDVRAAIRFMRRSLSRHAANGEVTIDFNKYFLQKFKQLDLQKFRERIKKTLRSEEYNVHADYFFKGKKYKQAIKEAENAMGQNRDTSAKKIFEILGFSYAKTGQDSKAIGCLKEAEKKEPKNAKINFELAKCYERIGEAGKSKKQMEKGLYKVRNLKYCFESKEGGVHG